MASDLGWGAWEADPATCKTPLLHLFPFLIIAVEVWVLLPWYGAEQWVRYFPDERLGGVEHKEFPLSCKRVISYSVTWKGNTISAQCLGFLGVFFVCFVLLFLLLGFFSLFP